MHPPVIEPGRAAELAERLLDTLNEARDIISRPPYEGQYARLRELLLSAQAVAEETVELPPYRSDGKETGISRQGILLAVEGEIPRLANLKIAAKLHLARGDAFTEQPWRTFVSVAVVVRSLLAAPNINPGEEVSGDDERDPAETFLG